MKYAKPEAAQSVHTFYVAAQSVDDGFTPDIRIDVFPDGVTALGDWFRWVAMDSDEFGANFLIAYPGQSRSIERATYFATKHIASLFA